MVRRKIGFPAKSRRKTIQPKDSLRKNCCQAIDRVGLSDKLEKENLRSLLGFNSNLGLIIQCRAIARYERPIIKHYRTASELNPCMSFSGNAMPDPFACLQNSDRDGRVLVELHLAQPSIPGSDGTELAMRG